MSIAPGDRVAYAARFLKSIGAFTGDMPAGRGRVIAIKPCGGMTLATVEWEAGLDLPTTINASNLCKTTNLAAMASNQEQLP